MNSFQIELNIKLLNTEEQHKKPEQLGNAFELIPDLEELRSYTQRKLALGELLRTIRQSFIVLGREDAEIQYREWLAKLAEDRFTLAVLGQFKRGKSSLMNAIIGEELLPTGVLPLTSAITILKYGPSKRLVVHRENALYPAELPVTELAGYVTEKENPHNQKKVIAAYVELPVAFLRYGIEFVDTPGVGSSISENTETTYKFLPECDAVLFVTGMDSPMTHPELQLLQMIRNYAERIFFVVNKIDLVAENEQEEILSFVSQTIREAIGSKEIKLYPVSSKLALQARITGNERLYEHSRLNLLEEALASFLTKEKASAFLAAISQKALRLLHHEMSQHIFTEEYLQKRKEIIQQEKKSVRQNDPPKALAVLDNAKLKLENYYREMVGQPVAKKNFHITEERPETIVENNAVPPIPSFKAPDFAPGPDVRGCPVCEHISEKAFDFFAHWQYQLFSNEKAQNDFAEELGFCPLHSWQLLALSSPQGASIGYSKLADKVAYLLKTQKDFFKTGDAIRNLVHHSKNCRVCTLLRAEEKQYIQYLATTLEEMEAQRKYLHSQGVCLWHLGLLTDALPDAELRELILHHEATLFAQDAEDMRSFSLKNEALRRALQNKNEKDAYRRTIIRIVGEQSVCLPWAQDGEI
jgi:GTPase Era involved in 16S rRNA processing